MKTTIHLDFFASYDISLKLLLIKNLLKMIRTKLIITDRHYFCAITTATIRVNNLTQAHVPRADEAAKNAALKTWLADATKGRSNWYPSSIVYP